jgi:glyceraldehyde 3-phosphate dehydrogenase
VPVGSIVDLVAKLSRPADRDEVNAAFRAAAARSPLAEILRYAEQPLVSSDILRSPHSCILDSQLTMRLDRLIKVLGWYDNEWGYSRRLVDLVSLVGRRSRAAAHERLAAGAQR